MSSTKRFSTEYFAPNVLFYPTHRPLTIRASVSATIILLQFGSLQIKIGNQITIVSATWPVKLTGIEVRPGLVPKIFCHIESLNAMDKISNIDANETNYTV